MKLISCHIENFGKLNSYSVSFSDGANLICEDNGWGKSTFAAFIRAMFYGLEGTKKRSINENERKRYKPWQGGVFGGNIVFEADGKRYILTRTFGDNENADTFELRDAATNLLSEDYSSTIGEELFKIDRKSFMRTVFIGQTDCVCTATDDINARIGNLSDDTNDMNSFEAAEARLTAVMNALNPLRTTGSVSRRSREIAELERNASDGASIPETMAVYRSKIRDEQQEYDKYSEKAAEASAMQKKVTALQTLIARKDEWLRLKDSLRRKEETFASVKESFPLDKIPSSDETDAKLMQAEKLAGIDERVTLHCLSDAEKNELDGLKTVFADGVPSEEIIDAEIERASALNELRRRLGIDAMDETEEKRLDELKSEFEDETEKASYMEAVWNRRCSSRMEEKMHEQSVVMPKNQREVCRSAGSRNTLLKAAAVLALICGVALAIFTSPVAGIAVALSGVVLLILGITGDKKNNALINGYDEQISDIENSLAECRSQIKEADEHLQDYLERHGRRFLEDHVAEYLQEIKDEEAEYRQLVKKAECSPGTKDRETAEKISGAIGKFLALYGIKTEESRFIDELYELKSSRVRFLSLGRKAEEFEKAACEGEKIRTAIEDFLIGYGFKPEEDLSAQLKSLGALVRDYSDASGSADEAAAELKAFESKNDMSQVPDDAEIRLLPALDELHREADELKKLMEQTHRNITEYQSMLNDLSGKYDDWEEQKQQLEELKEVQAVEKEKYRLVKIARDKLIGAKTAMTARYSDPILNSFAEYYSMITGETGDNFHVDANINVTVDELGRQRDVDTLSLGYRDLIGIALRLSLVDAMYTDEKPVIIMDDPFTNLDDTKVSAALNFIDRVSRKYQIIYFTCSHSRG